MIRRMNWITRDRLWVNVLVVCCLVFYLDGVAQVSLSTNTVDYQLLDNSSNRYVDVEIRNTGNEKAFIFRLETPETYSIRFSNKTLEPDSVRYIRIKYNPEKTGYFEDKLLLHLSSSAEPILIKTKGFVTEFQPNASPDCPSFDQKDIIQETSFALTVEVVEKYTGKPINDANVKLILNGAVGVELTTKSNGKASREVPLGLYYFVFRAEGYHGEEFMQYVNKNNNFVRAELERSQPVEDTTEFEDVIVVNPPDTTEFENEIVINTDSPAIDDDTIVSVPEVIDSSDFSVNEYAPNNIVFCVDISSSMKYTGKLDLLKASMIELTEMLRPIDNITIVTYATEAEVLMETTSAGDKQKIIEAIQSLEAKGHTAGIAGMKLAYSKACNGFIHDGNNMVIMATDGGFNRGKGSTKRLAKKYSRKDIKMSVVGIKNTYRHEQAMREVAVAGTGHYVKIKTYEDAQRALTEEIKSQSSINGL